MRIAGIQTYSRVNFLLTSIFISIFISNTIASSYFSTNKNIIGFYYSNILSGFAIIFFLYFFIHRYYVKNINFIENKTDKIVSEKYTIFELSSEPSHSKELKEINKINRHLNRLFYKQDDAKTFVWSIREGAYDGQLQYLSKSIGLGKSLIEMQKKLIELHNEQNKRQWLSKGQNHFSEIVRNNTTKDWTEFSDSFIKELVKYLNINQGGIYLINEENKDDVHIELVSCFAYDRKKHTEKRINMKEGLIGRCVQESETIYLSEIPNNYLSITSGLGDANPKWILLVPIKSGNLIYGVIEIASFRDIDSTQIEFVEKISEGYAASVNSYKTNLRTQHLLNESLNKTEELKLKEEVLKRNEDELMDTQKDLQRKIIEIETESKLTQSILNAINKTNAVIDLDMEGNIIEANEIYLSIMEYSKDELIGKPERYFISQNEITSGRYDLLWHSIKNGSFNSGEFKRRSRNGKELWLTGSYSPIIGLDGEPYKVIQFAQFTTEQKIKELDFCNKLDSINKSVAILEVNMEGKILSFNSFLLKRLGYERVEIKNKDIKMIMPEEYSSSPDFKNTMNLLKEGTPQEIVLTFVTKHGEHMITRAFLNPTKNLEGKIDKIIMIIKPFVESPVNGEQQEMSKTND
jgi:PAS domain S-box-containing protein